MKEAESSKRGPLVRNAVVFQLKLVADGFRDLVLIPVSFFAAVIGLLRGGDEPEREFNQVIDIGRKSEKWINLFGTYDVPENSNMGTSIEVVFAKLEEVLKQHYKAGGTSKSAQAEIGEALQTVHDQTRQDQSDH